MLQNAPLIALAFLIYFAAVLWLGYRGWQRTDDLAGFILGKRSLGPWVTAFSAQASDMSGWLLMGLPGLAYAGGFQAVWLALGLLAGTYVNWRWVALPLRLETERLGNALTLPDYFERRFEDNSGRLRTLTALFILVFFTFYTASGFVAAGRLFQTLFGLSYPLALLLGAFSVLAYTFVGGFLAVSWADVLQGSLMFIALVLVAGVSLSLNGGFGGVADTLNALNPALLSPWLKADGQPLGWIAIVSLLAWGLGYPGQPHILARFKAVRHGKDLAISTRVAMVWVSVSLGAALLVGYTGIGVLAKPLAGTDTEKVFIYLSLQLFPALVAGLCLSGILAAVMSTAAAQLLVASAAFAGDLYKGLWRMESSEAHLLRVGRSAVAVIAVLAYFIALNPDSTVLALVAHAWAGFGAVFGPVLLLSLYWQGLNRRGALVGMGVGGATVLLWNGAFGLYELLPGFVLSAVAAVAASLWERRGTL